MADIVLLALNARYIHSSLGLRYLRANLGELEPRSALVEMTLADRPADVVEVVLAERPRVVGIGVYVWNARRALEVVRILRLVAPGVAVVVGGPEVSHEIDEQEICQRADYVVAGEGEWAFRDLCRALLADARPEERVIRAPLPNVAELRLPYSLYDDDDLAHRVVYVGASRGCPFRCEFCLSALDRAVRAFPLQPFLDEMDALWSRGARTFKFIDRTFNLKVETAAAILDFFLDRIEPETELFVHFEMIPDRLPEQLRERLRLFPAGALQLEVGIQTLDEDTARRIERRQRRDALEDNLRFLDRDTGAHVHADLIVGLPGENMESFARGFDALVALRPEEIQVGILKRLRGTPIVRHTEEFAMIFSEEAPYEVLSTRDIGFSDMQRLKRFARAWDLVANSGNFVRTAPLLWGGGSAFSAFLAFSDWLEHRVGAFAGIALPRLGALLHEYLVAERGLEPETARVPLHEDLQRLGRSLPPELRTPRPERGRANARQARHRGR